MDQHFLPSGRVHHHPCADYSIGPCAAVGLARPALRPIFEADRVTVQPLFGSFACYPAALLGVVEATIAVAAEKNRVCPPIRYWDEPRDYMLSYLALMVHERARAAYPAVAAWAKRTRLNSMSGLDGRAVTEH